VACPQVLDYTLANFKKNALPLKLGGAQAKGIWVLGLQVC